MKAVVLVLVCISWLGAVGGREAQSEASRKPVSGTAKLVGVVAKPKVEPGKGDKVSAPVVRRTPPGNRAPGGFAVAPQPPSVPSPGPGSFAARKPPAGPDVGGFGPGSAIQPCPVGLVSKATPEYCATPGGSPVRTEMRYIGHMGFVDGMHCAVWPQAVRGNSATVLAVLTGKPTKLTFDSKFTAPKPKPAPRPPRAPGLTIKKKSTATKPEPAPQPPGGRRATIALHGTPGGQRAARGLASLKATVVKDPVANPGLNTATGFKAVGVEEPPKVNPGLVGVGDLKAPTEGPGYKEDAKWWFDRAGHLNWVVFGSKRELVVRTIPWNYKGIATMPVAVDVLGGYGMVLDRRWVCSEAKMQAGDCLVREGVIGSKEVSILCLQEATTAEDQSVMLVSETVTFRSSVTLGVNLAVMAKDVSTVVADVKVTLLNDHDPIGSLWSDASSALNAIPTAPILGVFADTIEGIKVLKTTAKGRATVLEVTSVGNDPLEKDHKVAGSTIQVTVPRVCPHTMSIDEEVSPPGPGTSYTWYNVVVEIARPMKLRKSSQGGTTMAMAGDTGSPVLVADGDEGVEVVVDSEALHDYAEAMAQMIYDAPVGMNDRCCGCEQHLFPPPCGGKPNGCVFSTTCDLRGEVRLEFAGTSFEVHKINDTDAVADSIYQAVEQMLLDENIGNFNTQGGKKEIVDAKKASFAAHALSDGILFDTLSNAADYRSRRFSLPAEEWKDLGRAIDVFSNSALETLVGSSDRVDSVQRKRSYVEMYDSASPIKLNGIGLPFGKLAVGWHPSHLPQDSEATSMLGLSTRWNIIDEMLEEIDGVRKAQDAGSLLNGLLGASLDHLDLTKTTAEALRAAAQENAMSQSASLEKLEGVLDEVEAAKDEFEGNVVSMWDCPSSFASCHAVIAAKGEALKQSCESEVPLLNLLDFMIEAVSMVYPIAGIVGDIAGNENLMNLLSTGVGAVTSGNFDGSKLKGALKWVGDQKKLLSKVSEGLKKTKEVAGKLFDRFLSVENACEEMDREEEVEEVKELRLDLTFMEATARILDLHVSELNAMMQSVQAHVTYLLTAAEVYGKLITGSSRLKDEVSHLLQTSTSGLAKGRLFLKAACRTTHKVVDTAMTDYKAVSDTLTTMAGQYKTSASLYIPRSPALGSAVPTSRRDSFAVSIWDRNLFSPFTAAGGLSQPKFLDVATDRFNEFVRKQVCGKYPPSAPDSLASHKFVVRRVITGSEFATFHTTGRVMVDVDMVDIMRGAEASGSTFSATHSRSAQGVEFAMSPAVLLNFGYSVCTGPPEDPCCSGDGCRRAFPAHTPHLVHRASYVPSRFCKSGSAATEASFDGTTVETCLETVTVTGGHAEALYIESPEDGDAPLLEKHVLERICDVDPSALALVPMRGRSALGVFELVRDSVVAAALANDAVDAPPQTPQVLEEQQAFIDGNSDATGIEVFFFAAAEARTYASEYNVQTED